MDRHRRIAAQCILIAILWAVPGLAGDWPRYMKDARRSNATDEDLALPLVLRWTYTPTQRPRPAWPDPLVEPTSLDFTFTRNISQPVILDFDYASHPVVVGDLVFFGSSADDTVRAVSLATGKPVWQFTTGGPIRFAPDVADGRLYVASDDGVLYCREAKTGKGLWQFRAAPEERSIMGNGRLISRWPLRSGALVVDDTVYVSAGMWPSEGVFLYALDAKTGERRWLNDTCGVVNERTPVPGAYTITGVAPQGYLLAHKETLVVPTGRAVPASFSRLDGRLIHFTNPSYQNKRGGHWATISPRGLLTFGSPRERLSGKQNGLFEMRHLPNVGANYSRFWADRVVFGKDDRFVAHNSRIYRHSRAKRYRGKLTWETPYPVGRAHCMVLAGETLFVGGDRQILALDAAAGTERWRAADLDARVRSIAIANGRLLAATDSGRIYVFGPGGNGGATHQEPPRPAPPRPTAALPAAVEEALTKQEITAGLALVFGGQAVATAREVVARSRLQVVVLLPDGEIVQQERNRLAREMADYGTRLSLMPESALAGRVLPDYAFNLILAGRAVTPAEAKTLCRVLQPCRGLLHIAGDFPASAADAASGEITRLAKGTALRRGPLPGAFDWNTPYRKDKRVKWPLELLWFGEPGPKLMQSGGLMPVAANGRNYIAARNHFFCFDAYNGAELWRRPIPYLWRHVVRAKSGPGPAKSLVHHFAATDDRAFLCLGEQVYEFEAQTGRGLKIYGAFKPATRYRLDQPVVIEVGRRQAYAEPDGKLADKDLFREEAGAKNILTATVSATAKDLVISLAPGFLEPSDRDHVELFMDVRPPEARNSLYSKGAFHVLVHTSEGRLQLGTGPWHPTMTLDRGEGGGLVLRIPWASLAEAWAGAKDDFGLALAVNHPTGEAFRQRALERRDRAWNPTLARATMRWTWSCDDTAYAINNGWARFTRGTAAPAAHGPEPRPMEMLPDDGARSTQKPPIGKNRSGAQTGPGTRTTALTLSEDPMTFNRGKGCGRTIASEQLLVARAGNLGFYDFQDDSGMRHFGGVRAGCGMSMIPALGVVFAPESSPTCSCNYNYKCSLAMAPTSVRRQEDWAVYKGVIAAGALFKSGYFNLGAPGDRRDDGGRLWLQFPRPPTHTTISMPTPLQLDGEGMKPIRLNADRTVIAGSARPWIHASGIEGVERAEVQLYMSDDRRAMSFPIETPPKLDAALDDDCWDKEYGIFHGAGRSTSLYLRHDEQALYIGCRKTPAIDRKGKTIPWKRTEEPGALPQGVVSFANQQPAEDVEVWQEESVELFFTDSKTAKVLHLGVSITGKRFDAICTVRDIGAKKGAATDAAFSTSWSGALQASETEIRLELAIPWKSFAEAGLDRSTLMLRPYGSGPVRAVPYPTRGYRPLWVEKASPGVKRYRVTLLFAELAGLEPGARVFDIRVQNTIVAENVDIAGQAGGPLKALAKAFSGIAASKTMLIELLPKTGRPLLCGLALEEE